MGEPEDNTEFVDTIKFVYKVLEKKIDRQIELFNTLQSKVGNLFAFTSALVGGYLTLIVGRQISLLNGSISSSLYSSGLISLIGALLCLMQASRTRVFFDPPDIDTIYSERAFRMKTEDLKNQIASDMKASYNLTSRNLKQIAEHYDAARRTLLASVLLVVVASILDSQTML